MIDVDITNVDGLDLAIRPRQIVNSSEVGAVSDPMLLLVAGIEQFLKRCRPPSRRPRISTRDPGDA